MAAPVPRPTREAPSPSIRPHRPSAFPTIHYHHPLPHFPTDANSFPSYHIHTSPVFSCAYALFCATATRYPLSLQCLAHSFYRHGGVPQRLRLHALPAPGLSLASGLANHMFSAACSLFCKDTRGGGVPRLQLSQRLGRLVRMAVGLRRSVAFTLAGRILLVTA
jgi:hypothetical protein